MKKSLLVFLGLATIAFTGCQKWLDDVADSPNTPIESSPAFLLTVAEISTFSTYSGQLARQASILTQQSAGTDFQMIDIARYDIKEGTNVNEWNQIYTDGLINPYTMINDPAYSEGNPYYVGIAKVIMAMNLGIATDHWGDIPYSEALQGIAGEGEEPVLEPSSDSQQDIYTSIQTLLDEAIAEFAKPATDNASVPGGDDLIFGGDVAAWTTAAYMLKARYHNHLSQRDASGSASAALAALNNAGLSGTSDDMNAVFGVNGNENNQWYAFTQNRGGYIQMGEFLMDMLEITSDTNMVDPRQSFIASMDANGGYSGTPVGSVDQTTSTIGAYFGSSTSNAPLITYVECKFIEAEAELRAGNAGAAATAHNEAVTASVEQITGATIDSTFAAMYASEDGSSITLETIMNQKYIAMFSQAEVWTDWRRTGFPTLSPNTVDAVVNGIPLRLPTPRDERVTNSVITVNQNILDPVWWDN
jgi:hypothetical protein